MLLSGDVTFSPDLPGTYVFQLEYSDGVGFSEPARSNAVTAIDRPLAHVKQDVEGATGDALTLEGSAEYVVGPAKYQWRLASKPAASTISEPESPVYDFQAFIVPDVPGAYVVELPVVDDGGTSDPVLGTITAR